MAKYKHHNSKWFVSRCDIGRGFPRAMVPGEWQLMPVVPSALTHNPLLHRATQSPQRE